jgi:CBS domain containing-hemolysin-like protein
VLSIDDDFFDEYRGESDSLGGLILEMSGKIPKKGEKLYLNPFEFEILDSDNRKINQVKVILRQTDEYAEKNE